LIIVYSSISCALACGSNEACETLRFRSRGRGEGGWFPPANEDVSPNNVNPFRPRYTKLLTANLPDVVKPVTDVEEINACTHQVSRGDWGERASKEQHRYLGDPSRGVPPEVGGTRGNRGNHNPACLRRRKSERPVGTMTRGNSRRVKGPYRYRVFRSERSSA
jgi:hypothetical protein